MIRTLFVVASVVVVSGCASVKPPEQCHELWTKDQGPVLYCQSGDYVDIRPIR